MADWPNVLVPNKISTLLDYIKRVNRPTKVTVEWLVAANFKSTNDRALIGLLKALDYLDGAGAPTGKWADLKDSDAVRAASIGRQMQVAYPDVFANWPSTFVRDSLSKDDLRNFIRPKITAGEATVDNIVATFFALRALASFDAAPAAPGAPIVAGAARHEAVTAVAPPASQVLNVTINLSLEIPPTSEADVYDKLFAAMAKHLGSLGDRGTGH